MSTFEGFLKEVPGIAVDRFIGKCLKSQFLFLSHCHSDHMVGLNSNLKLSAPLFASEVSTVFLRKQFPNIASVIEPLKIETPLHLNYTFEGVEYSLEVTALPAKHCPGSVMFLFETRDRVVLYTGDFRLTKKDLQKYEILQKKQIDCVYMDSTFLLSKFNEFPKREESLHQICSLIKKWLDINPENNAILEMPARYGMEFLFVGIQRKLKEKIYVQPNETECYIYFPLLDKCIETNQTKCRIIAKLKYGANKVVPDNVRVIKPTAMYWENWERGQPIVEKVLDKNEYRVAYSSHCSCSELKDFLDFVKPKSVSLNVIPVNCEELLKDNLLKIYNPAMRIESDVYKEDEPITFENMFIVDDTPTKRKENIPPDGKVLPKRLKM